MAEDIDALKNDGYASLINELKIKITQARIRAHLSVNKELIMLYWDIGNKILERQNAEGWGAKVIENISKDLQIEFPEMTGFGIQNLRYMRRFAEEYSSDEISQQAADQLPWGHNIVLMYEIADRKERTFYIQKAIENGWSRNVLSIQIETDLYARQGGAITNFVDKLPSPQSDLANQTLKDPYIFDFLSISEDAHERDLEKALTTHIQKFLLELGVGFSFVGSQYHITVGKKDYFIDMLFYHLKLRSYVVIELKTKELEPRDVGQINFYLAAIDDKLKHVSDNPSIGLLLCRSKGDKITAEYALRNVTSPIGIASYKLSAAVPKELADSLPSIEQIESKLKLIAKGN
jgi:predicted nuclease of restriction endonuclease-like (RecB) superfamily